MKKLFIEILRNLKRFTYLLLIFLILPASIIIYWLWLTPKSIKEVKTETTIYNLRKHRANCKNDCYIIWICASYYKSCSSSSSSIFIDGLDEVYDIYIKNGILYISTISGTLIYYVE